MKHSTFASALFCLALSGCMQTQADHVMQKESVLWQKAGKRAGAECASYSKDDPAQAPGASACVAKIVRETVLPRATYPDLVVTLIGDQAVVSQKFHDRKVTRQQADAEARQLQARYQALVASRLHGE